MIHHEAPEERERIRALIIGEASHIAEVVLNTPPDRTINLTALAIQFHEAIGPAVRQFRKEEHDQYLERLHDHVGELG